MAAPAGPSPVKCFRCGAPGVWHAQANQWGCDHCRQLIGGPPQLPAPGAATPPAWAAPPPANPFAGQPTPKCPRCWGDGTWHPQAGKWGCDRCKTFIDAATIAPQANPNDFGLRMAKALLWIVLLIALIALKVYLRGHR